MEITCTQPVVTKHVRIRLNNENIPLRLCEVEIYGGREVSFSKPTSQSSNYALWFPGKAVDGRYPRAGDTNNVEEHMCSRTNGNENNPWWMVDLQTTFALYDVSFFGRRSTTEQSEGFYISIGNSSTETEDIFHDSPVDQNDDPTRYLPRKTELTTPYTTKFVKVHMRPYSGTSTLSICEMHIFADCTRNKCGLDCQKNCHCKGEITGPMKIDGVCPNGCSERWTGKNNRCDTECSEVQWGEECQNKCGNCMELPCDIVTGHCKERCAGPWIPPLCLQECESGTFGINCEGRCGKCLNGTACSITTGDCMNGCDPGWQGRLCDIACEDGKYGKECLGTCGKCRNDKTCNPRTGKCDDGCHPGYYGELCDKDRNILLRLKRTSKMMMSSTYNKWAAEKAVDGSFDADPETCHCCSGTNNEMVSSWSIELPRMYPIQIIIVYGRKNEQAFQQLNGFDLILKNNTAEDGLTVYKNSVSQSNVCEITMKNTLAKIIEISRPGKLTVCEVRVVEGVCQVGSFGEECSEKCHCADKKPCDRETGVCMAPICEIGFIGPACDQVCHVGTFGKECSVCKTPACEIGFTGPACDQATESSDSPRTRETWLVSLAFLVIETI